MHSSLFLTSDQPNVGICLHIHIFSCIQGINIYMAYRTIRGTWEVLYVVAAIVGRSANTAAECSDYAAMQYLGYIYTKTYLLLI